MLFEFVPQSLLNSRYPNASFFFRSQFWICASRTSRRTCQDLEIYKGVTAILWNNNFELWPTPLFLCFLSHISQIRFRVDRLVLQAYLDLVDPLLYGPSILWRFYLDTFFDFNFNAWSLEDIIHASYQCCIFTLVQSSRTIKHIWLKLIK